MSGSELAPFVAAALRDKVVLEMREEIKALRAELHKNFKVELWTTLTSNGEKVLISTSNSKRGIFTYEFPSGKVSTDCYVITMGKKSNHWVALGELSSLVLVIGGVQRVVFELSSCQVACDGRGRFDLIDSLGSVLVKMNQMRINSFNGSFADFLRQNPAASVGTGGFFSHIVLNNLAKRFPTLFRLVDPVGALHLKCIADAMILEGGTLIEPNESWSHFNKIIYQTQQLGFRKRNIISIEGDLQKLVHWMKLVVEADPDNFPAAWEQFRRRVRTEWPSEWNACEEERW